MAQWPIGANDVRPAVAYPVRAAGHCRPEDCVRTGTSLALVLLLVAIVVAAAVQLVRAGGLS
jgi:hypothetical protein